MRRLPFPNRALNLVPATLAKTPLWDWHAAHGGRMVDFAGWSMPVQYTSIVAEHQATRRAAGLFDVSHMGRLRFAGPSAADFLNSLLTRSVADLEPGQVLYSLVTNEQGGILDDVLVYSVPHDTTPYHLLVVNASNREKIVDWVQRHLAGRGDVECTDITQDTAMIAVQGPLAVRLVVPRMPIDVADMKYYHAAETTIGGETGLVSRTGYTGEDGFELIVAATVAPELWEGLLTEGQAQGVLAAGLGARDTLRLEAAMPLYGHELTEEINPLEAGLSFAVDLDGRTFPGAALLQAVKRDGPKRARVGLELAGRRPAREHYAIVAEGRPIGEVTSGTFSPTLQKPIAMGYVPPQYAKPGTELMVDIRGTQEPARVVKLPFYRRQLSKGVSS